MLFRSMTWAIAALEDGPEIAQVIHMRTVHMGPDSVLVAAKVAVREGDSAAQISAGIDTAERRVRTAVPIAKTIYLEPDIYRPTEADQSDPAIRSVRRSQAPVPPSADDPSSATGPSSADVPASSDVPASADGPASSDVPASADGPRNPANPENPAPQASPSE